MSFIKSLSLLFFCFFTQLPKEKGQVLRVLWIGKESEQRKEKVEGHSCLPIFLSISPTPAPGPMNANDAASYLWVDRFTWTQPYCRGKLQCPTCKVK